MEVGATAEQPSRRERWSDWELEQLLRTFPLVGPAPLGEALSVLADDLGRTAYAVGRMWIAAEAQISGQRPLTSPSLRRFVIRRISPVHKYLGVVPVDAGAILITDPSYILARDGIGGEDYNHFLAALFEGSYMAHGMALIVQTGGDFVFPVYGDFEGDDLVRVIVDLNPNMAQAMRYWKENREMVRAAASDSSPRPPSTWA
jgi:hypothetical protein